MWQSGATRWPLSAASTSPGDGRTHPSYDRCRLRDFLVKVDCREILTAPERRLFPVVCEVCGRGRADPCGTVAPGDGTDAGGRAVRAEDQADRGGTASSGEPEAGLPVAPVVAGAGRAGFVLPRPERVRRSRASRTGCRRPTTAPTASPASTAATPWATTACGVSTAAARAPPNPGTVPPPALAQRQRPPPRRTCRPTQGTRPRPQREGEDDSGGGRLDLPREDDDLVDEVPPQMDDVRTRQAGASIRCGEHPLVPGPLVRHVHC